MRNRHFSTHKMLLSLKNFNYQFQKDTVKENGYLKTLSVLLFPSYQEKALNLDSKITPHKALVTKLHSNDALINDTLKIILMWNEWNSNMVEPFSKIQCPKNSCLFTTDISLINQSDVVVLHFDTLKDFPVNRQPHQRFVFYHMESPENTASLLMEDPRFRFNYFNWTMTYRRDSDIFLRDYYGSVVSKLSNNGSNHELRYKYYSTGKRNYISNSSMEVNLDVSTENPKKNFIGRKSKMIIWLVGNCLTTIRREEYVHQLSKYVPIDIFGKCTQECPSNCDEMIRSTYKFYLAFENSWCPDYITEKFSRSLLYEAIPIVLGGADYSFFAPPNSYINARDFSSPKELAEYIILLNRTDELYASYFSWKNEYYMSVPDMYGWCELCIKANDINLPSKIYRDIKQWWMDDGGKCEYDSRNLF
jgi:alpha-1,3-fucosyltransferase